MLNTRFMLTEWINQMLIKRIYVNIMDRLDVKYKIYVNIMD